MQQIAPMMNPSTSGWVDKFFLEQQFPEQTVLIQPLDFYLNVRDSGFIYGHVISLPTNKAISTEGWLIDEITKVSLLNFLWKVYSNHTIVETTFLKSATDFYEAISPRSKSVFSRVLPEQSKSKKLESIIDERIQVNGNALSKSFSHIVTNALMFIDVLAFDKYLSSGKVSDKYIRKIEETIALVVTAALKSKLRKSEYDDQLIRLFESSLRFGKFPQDQTGELSNIDFSNINSDLEKFYIIDIAGLALYSDGIVEQHEKYFLQKLSQNLNVDAAFVDNCLMNLNLFVEKYRDVIPYLNFINPVKHFYDSTTQLVVMLIKRNKKRLLREITDSRELMSLLAASTSRDLTKQEKKKVRRQLLDICKTVPSLTIFLIPGGSILLPILIKFIPQLLPSAFNENLHHD